MDRLIGVQAGEVRPAHAGQRLVTIAAKFFQTAHSLARPPGSVVAHRYRSSRRPKIALAAFQRSGPAGRSSAASMSTALSQTGGLEGTSGMAQQRARCGAAIGRPLRPRGAARRQPQDRARHFPQLRRTDTIRQTH